MTINETVAAEIRYHAARHWLRQGRLADLAGIPRSSMSARMQNRTSFKIGELARIADVLGVPVSRLVGGADVEASR